MYVYVYVVCVIQGVSRLVDITAGGDSLGLCDQKTSYKYVSDFERLRSYGHFLIHEHASVWTASSESAGGWRTQLGGLLFAFHALFLPPDTPTHYRQSSFRISKRGKYLRNAEKVGWVGIRLASLYCMTELLLCVQKPFSLTFQRLCRLLMFRKSTAIVS
jgi:hypothetical protein